MEVAAHNIGASFRNSLRTPRLLIIEFVLRELSDTGTAGQMLLETSPSPQTMSRERRGSSTTSKSYLISTTMEPSRNISLTCAPTSGKSKSTLLPIHYNSSTHNRCDRSGCDYDHAVVIVHTHSDDNRGDLFYTSKGDDEGGPLATPIELVSSLFVTH